MSNIKGSHHRRRRLLPVAAGIVGIVLAGCSTEPPASEAGGDTTDELSVVIVSAGTFNLTNVAYAADLFEKNDLSIDLTTGVGGNAPTLVATGSADVVSSIGLSQGLAVSASGKQTAAFWADSGGGNGGMFVGTPDLNSLEDLAAVDNCVIATFFVGASAYGQATLYNEKFGLGCDILPLPDPPAVIAAFKSGQANALVGAAAQAIPLVDAGEANILIDTRDDDDRTNAFGVPYLEQGQYGLVDTLEEKRSAIVKYLRSLAEAAEYLMDHSDEEVADLLINDGGDFATISRDLVIADVAAGRAFIWVGSDEGFISEDQWNTSLDAFAGWGIPNFERDNSLFAYDVAVDMSYYEDAFGK